MTGSPKLWWDEGMSRRANTCRLLGAPTAALAAVAGVLVGLAGAPAAGDEARKVTIKGKADQSGHNYEWTITNHSNVPIVTVQFAHFQIDQFLVPEKWSQEGSTFLDHKLGICRASAVAPDKGLATGQSLVLKGRVRPVGAYRGAGPVTVGFADGSTVTVADVALPTREPAAGKYTRLMGFMALGLLFLIVVGLRRRRHESTEGGTHADVPN